MSLDTKIMNANSGIITAKMITMAPTVSNSFKCLRKCDPVFGHKNNLVENEVFHRQKRNNPAE